MLVHPHAAPKYRVFSLRSLLPCLLAAWTAAVRDSGGSDLEAALDTNLQPGAPDFKEVVEELDCTERWFQHYSHLQPDIAMLKAGLNQLTEALKHADNLAKWTTLFDDPDVSVGVKATQEEMSRLIHAGSAYQHRLEHLAKQAQQELNDGGCGVSSTDASGLLGGVGTAMPSLGWRSPTTLKGNQTHPCPTPSPEVNTTVHCNCSESPAPAPGTLQASTTTVSAPIDPGGGKGTKKPNEASTTTTGPSDRGGGEFTTQPNQASTTTMTRPGEDRGSSKTTRKPDQVFSTTTIEISANQTGSTTGHSVQASTTARFPSGGSRSTSVQPGQVVSTTTEISAHQTGSTTRQSSGEATTTLSKIPRASSSSTTGFPGEVFSTTSEISAHQTGSTTRQAGQATTTLSKSPGGSNGSTTGFPGQVSSTTTKVAAPQSGSTTGQFEQATTNRSSTSSFPEQVFSTTTEISARQSGSTTGQSGQASTTTTSVPGDREEDESTRKPSQVSTTLSPCDYTFTAAPNTTTGSPTTGPPPQLKEASTTSTLPGGSRPTSVQPQQATTTVGNFPRGRGTSTTGVPEQVSPTTTEIFEGHKGSTTGPTGQASTTASLPSVGSKSTSVRPEQATTTVGELPGGMSSSTTGFHGQASSTSTEISAGQRSSTTEQSGQASTTTRGGWSTSAPPEQATTTVGKLPRGGSSSTSRFPGQASSTTTQISAGKSVSTTEQSGEASTSARFPSGGSRSTSVQPEQATTTVPRDGSSSTTGFGQVSSTTTDISAGRRSSTTGLSRQVATTLDPCDYSFTVPPNTTSGGPTTTIPASKATTTVGLPDIPDTHRELDMTTEQPRQVFSTTTEISTDRSRSTTRQPGQATTTVVNLPQGRSSSTTSSPGQASTSHASTTARLPSGGSRSTSVKPEQVTTTQGSSSTTGFPGQVSSTTTDISAGQASSTTGQFGQAPSTTSTLPGGEHRSTTEQLEEATTTAGNIPRGWNKSTTGSPGQVYSTTTESAAGRSSSTTEQSGQATTTQGRFPGGGSSSTTGFPGQVSATTTEISEGQSSSTTRQSGEASTTVASPGGSRSTSAQPDQTTTTAGNIPRGWKISTTGSPGQVYSTTETAAGRSSSTTEQSGQASTTVGSPSSGSRSTSVQPGQVYSTTTETAAGQSSSTTEKSGQATTTQGRFPGGASSSTTDFPGQVSATTTQISEGQSSSTTRQSGEVYSTTTETLAGRSSSTTEQSGQATTTQGGFPGGGGSSTTGFPGQVSATTTEISEGQSSSTTSQSGEASTTVGSPSGGSRSTSAQPEQVTTTAGNIPRGWSISTSGSPGQVYSTTTETAVGRSGSSTEESGQVASTTTGTTTRTVGDQLRPILPHTMVSSTTSQSPEDRSSSTTGHPRELASTTTGISEGHTSSTSAQPAQVSSTVPQSPGGGSSSTTGHPEVSSTTGQTREGGSSTTSHLGQVASTTTEISEGQTSSTSGQAAQVSSTVGLYPGVGTRQGTSTTAALPGGEHRSTTEQLGEAAPTSTWTTTTTGDDHLRPILPHTMTSTTATMTSGASRSTSTQPQQVSSTTGQSSGDRSSSTTDHPGQAPSSTTSLAGGESRSTTEQLGEASSTTSGLPGGESSSTTERLREVSTTMGEPGTEGGKTTSQFQASTTAAAPEDQSGTTKTVEASTTTAAPEIQMGTTKPGEASTTTGASEDRSGSTKPAEASTTTAAREEQPDKTTRSPEVSTTVAGGGQTTRPTEVSTTVAGGGQTTRPTEVATTTAATEKSGTTKPAEASTTTAAREEQPDKTTRSPEVSTTVAGGGQTTRPTEATTTGSSTTREHGEVGKHGSQTTISTTPVSPSTTGQRRGSSTTTEVTRHGLTTTTATTTGKGRGLSPSSSQTPTTVEVSSTTTSISNSTTAMPLVGITGEGPDMTASTTTLEGAGENDSVNESMMVTTTGLAGKSLERLQMLDEAASRQYPWSLKDYHCNRYANEFKWGVWDMSDGEDVNMHVGWLVWAATGMCILLGSEVMKTALRQTPDPNSVAASGLAELCYGLFWGPGIMNLVMDVLVMAIALFNLAVYAMATEALTKNSPPWTHWALDWHSYVELGSFLCMCIVLTLRTVGAQAWPKYAKYGRSAWWRYLLLDGYANLDEISLVLTILTYTVCWMRYTNFIWFTSIRLIDMLARRGQAIPLRGIREEFAKERVLLMTMAALGFVVWLLVSGAYYCLNHDSDTSKWLWAIHEDHEAKDKRSLLELDLLADKMANLSTTTNTTSGGGAQLLNETTTTTTTPLLSGEMEGVFEAPWEKTNWQRFGSVPSSMFFALLNLCKKNPLAHNYKHFVNRVLIVAVNIFGVPMFALPLTTFGGVFMRISIKEALKEEEENDEDDDDEEEIEPDPATWYLNGRSYFVVAGLLAFGSAFAFFVETASKTEVRIMFVPVYVSGLGLACIDGVVGLVFAAEWYIRLKQDFQGYICSLWCKVDFLSFFPGVLHLILVLVGFDLNNIPGDCLKALCLIRIFKTERDDQKGGLGGSFSDMWRVFKMQRLLVVTTGIISLFFWMLAANMLYLSENTNPDYRMRYNFNSLSRAAYTEGINVMGEWIVADFTVTGKTICTFIALFSVSICVVPLMVLSFEYFRALAEDYNETMEMSEEISAVVWWQSAHRPDHPCLRRRIFDMYYAHIVPKYAISTKRFPTQYQVCRALTIGANLLSTLVTVMGTIPDIAKSSESKDGFTWRSWENCYSQKDCYALIHSVFWWIDAVTLPMFILNYSIRTYLFSWRQTVSILGAAELISIFAIALTLTPLRETYFDLNSKKVGFIREQGRNHLENFAETALSGRWIRNVGREDILFIKGFIFQLRVFRLFCIDTYVGTINVLKDVLYVHRRPLLRGGMILISIWYVHATMLYLIEKHDTRVDLSVTGMEMKERYKSALDAMHYSMVHLTGDFPISRYHWLAKLLLVPFISIGLISFAAFTGIFSSGFVNFLMRAREAELLEMADKKLALASMAAMKMQRNFRRLKERRQRAMDRVQSRRQALLHDVQVPPEQLAAAAERIRAQGDERARETHDQQGGQEDSVQQRGGVPWRERWGRLRMLSRAVIDGKHPKSRLIILSFHSVLLIDLFAILLLTIPEVVDTPAMFWGLTWLEAAVCCPLFLLEYAMRILAGGPLGQVFYPMRVYDLLCILPSPCNLYYVVYKEVSQRRHRVGLERFIQMVMLLRVIRILDFKTFRREVVTVFRGLSSAWSCLVVPGFLALYVWICTSSLFWWLENTYDTPSQKFFLSIPDAMYWVSHFLVGEWALIDFSQGAGTRICILTVLFGAMIFAIPLGIIVESVQSSLTMELLEDSSTQEVEAARRDSIKPKRKEQAIGQCDPLGDRVNALRRAMRKAAITSQIRNRRRSQEMTVDSDSDCESHTLR